MTQLFGPGDGRAAVALPALAPAGLERTELVSPRTVEEACRALVQAESEGRKAVVLAGGTDWVVDRHLCDVTRAEPIGLVVDVTSIDELRTVEWRVEERETRLVLWGGVTYWTLRTDPRIAGALPMLGRMAADVGAVQIQTRGTLAGNLATASPAADGVAALMALDARITLAREGSSRVVPIDSFFTGYRKTVCTAAEIITRIDVRVPPPGALVRWQKVGTRLAQAISKVALASAVEIEQGTVTRARFGMASVAPITAPLAGVRAFVEGKPIASLGREALDAAVEHELHPIDDVRSTAEYRLHVAKALVRRALTAPSA